SMQWNIALTALAVKARFKNKKILKQIASNNSGTKAVRNMWEDTILVFQQRALIEQAWGEDGPRKVSVKQFKNKLNSVRAAYKARRTRMLATGNRSLDDAAESEEDASCQPQLKYPELTLDYLSAQQEHQENSDEDVPLFCDPAEVNPIYREVLGCDVAALWQLLCDVFSRRPGCTGEAIIESGIVRYASNGDDEDDDGSDSDADSKEKAVSDSKCSDSPSDARTKAKAAAKAKKQCNSTSNNPTMKRPVDAMSDTLRAGFETIERVFSSRHSALQPRRDMDSLVEKLTHSIESANAQQRATSEAILQSIAGLHQVTVALCGKLTKSSYYGKTLRSHFSFIIRCHSRRSAQRTRFV
ncbi:hypothetical protein PHMEG_00031375, partial [Phytophthora megakarya]